MRKQWPRFAALFLLFSLAALGQAPAPTLEQRAQAARTPISGTLKAAGLQRPVTVLRDRWGVAHIFAQNQHDLFFAQGFVVAQDRLFQMELWKRSGQGRLAEILGPSAVQRDIYARLLRYRGPMDAEYSSYAPDGKAILEAFTDGINAYIASRTAPGGPGLPLEFQLAGFAPESWKPEDCLNRMAAFSMTNNAKAELHNAQMLTAMGVDKATAVSSFDPPARLEPPPGVDYASLSDELLSKLVGSDVRIEIPASQSPVASRQSPADDDPSIIGSNNWTVAGGLTRSGHPILANDPHRTIAEPSLRYIVHLVAPGWNVIGATEPGVPGVSIGHNQRIAWGLTIFGVDQQDLYLETLNPQNPLQYKTERGWQDMQAEKTVVHVKGAPDQEVTLKFTRHGPVLWEDKTRALALRWIGAEPGSAGYLAALSVDRAQNWNEFLSAMGRWKLPSENMVYADVDGNIGEQSAGLTPLRKIVPTGANASRDKTLENWTGLLPVPGDQGYEWTGFVPLDQLPRFFNPAAGFIATANNKMIPLGYPYPVGFQWAARDRVQRIEDVFNDAREHQHKLDVADMEQLQTDVTSLPARELLRLLKDAAGRESAADDPSIKMLLNWDGALTRDSAAAALYEFWLRRLREEVIRRTVPEQFRGLVRLSGPALLRTLTYPEGEGFGDNPEKSRDVLLVTAARYAAYQLTEQQGDPSTWRWGRLHTVYLRHPLDQTPGARELLDLGPLERPGDATTVNATGGEGFRQTAGASYREIFDLSDWDRSVGVNTPGQSGEPGSPHYSDLLALWSEGKYFPLLYSREAVEKQATNKLVLEP